MALFTGSETKAEALAKWQSRHAQEFDARSHGLLGDGSTDDAAAFEALLEEVVAGTCGRIYLPPGRFKISRALQDTGDDNAQIRIPFVSLDDEQCSIEIVGATPPEIQFYPNLTTIPPQNGRSIIESTLTGGSGTAAVIGGKGDSEHGQNQINIMLSMRDLIVRVPPNPSLTAVNLSECQACIIQNLLIDCGEPNLANLTEPTHANAYGMKLPGVNHSPNTKVDGLTIFGHYTGLLLGECDELFGVRIWGYKNGIEIPFSYHPTFFSFLGLYWGANGIYVTGNNKVMIGVVDMEHANGQGGAWQDQVSDLFDDSDLLYGEARFVSVSAGVGDDHTFTRVGGSNFLTCELGQVMGSTPITIDSAETIDDTTIEATFSRAVKATDYQEGVVIEVNSTPVTISAAMRQSDKTKVQYTVPTLAGTDVITLDYTELDGFLQSERGTHVSDASLSVANNIGVLTVLDAFTDTNGTAIGSHTIAPTNLPPTSWTAQENGFEIQSNKAEPTTSGVCSAVVDSGAEDIAMSCTVRRSGTSDTGLIFRVVDANNYWLAVLSASGQVILYEKTAGTYTSRANTGVVYSVNTDFVLAVQVFGNVITATVDGGSLITYTSSQHAGNTKQGIWTSGNANAGSFNDFSVTAQ